MIDTRPAGGPAHNRPKTGRRPGLPQRWQDAAAQRVTIPLAAGATDSLNAATAAAIVLFEIRRQRAHA